jgi:hypothetical protein
VSRCNECRREFPAHLIRKLERGDENGVISVTPMCPICAYRLINAERGLPADTQPPHTAPLARQMFLEALAHIRRDMEPE